MCPRPAPYCRRILPGWRALIFFALLVLGCVAGSELEAQTTLYWDNNGASPGSGGPSPGATWATGNSASARQWSTDPNGTSASVGWNPNTIAVFSAGADATGAFAVNVNGTQSVTGIYVEEGTPTFTSGTIKFNPASAIFDVASGSSAIVNTELSGAGTQLNKNGGGTLVLSGPTAIAGTFAVNEGTLEVSGNNLLTSQTNAVTVASGSTFSLSGSTGVANTNTIGALSGRGAVNIAADTVLQLNNASTDTFDGTIGGAGLFSKTGAGTLSFSAVGNTSAFNFSGTVQMAAANQTDTLEFHGGTAANALSIGTLRLNGGTLLLNASFINVGTLNITGDTILDFGTGGASILNANNIYIAAGKTLTIKNWTSEVDFLFANSSFRQTDESGKLAIFNATGSAPENQVVFDGNLSGDTPTTWVNDNFQGYTNFEIRPIPEPSMYGVGLIAGSIGLLAWRKRSRHRRSASP